jgi:hypothetical protein
MPALGFSPRAAGTASPTRSLLAPRRRAHLLRLRLHRLSVLTPRGEEGLTPLCKRDEAGREHARVGPPVRSQGAVLLQIGVELGA